MRMGIYLYISVIILLIFNLEINAHGFCSRTGVITDSGCFSLVSIKKRFKWVASYNFDTNSVDFSLINNSGSSKTNCYFKLRFNKDLDSCNSEILCTPTQIFYVPKKKRWVPAFDLQVGDELLGLHGNLEPLMYIEFINKSLEINTIEVKRNHNFFVGCHHHSVLAHNMLAPVGLWAGVSIAFGQGALAGGGAGSFWGPVTLAGGIIIGGLAGVAIHTLWQSHFQYSVSFDVAGIYQYKLKDHDSVYVSDISCCFKPKQQDEQYTHRFDSTQNYDDADFDTGLTLQNHTTKGSEEYSNARLKRQGKVQNPPIKSAMQSPMPPPKKDNDEQNDNELFKDNIDAENIKKSVEYATTKTKLIHFFESRIHGFDNLLDKMGGKNNINVQKELVNKIIKKLMKLDNLPQAGEFKNLIIYIREYPIHVRGFRIRKYY